MSSLSSGILPKVERKRLQIEHASQLSHRARLVKLADKICDLRDSAASPPAAWSAARKQKYFDWAMGHGPGQWSMACAALILA